MRRTFPKSYVAATAGLLFLVCCATQASAQGIETTILRSYQESFGRNPTDQETAYWAAQLKTKSLDYAGLLDAHKKWLVSDGGSAERTGMANRSVYEAFGRYPTVDELNDLKDLVAQGKNYAELMHLHIKSMYNHYNEQKDHPLVREMIRRAFKAAGLSPPSEPTIMEWLPKAKAQYLTFKLLVAQLNQ